MAASIGMVVLPKQGISAGGWEVRDSSNPCFGKSAPANFSTASASPSFKHYTANSAESAVSAAGDLSGDDSALAANAGGNARRKLLATQQETEPPSVRCPYYTELLQATESVSACTTDALPVQGVWFGATVKSGWVRQVRLQSKVTGSAADPSIYIAGIVMSVTKV